MTVASKGAAGVTLIELLVVCTIMMLSIGLVGGATVKSVERTQAQTELIELYAILKKSGVTSFVTGKTATLATKGQSVSLSVGSDLRFRREFEYLVFDEESIQFDRNGFSGSQSIEISVRGTPKLIDMGIFSSGVRNLEDLGGVGFEG